MMALVTVHSPSTCVASAPTRKVPDGWPKRTALALTAARREVHQRARNRGRRADGDRRRAHHRVVQLAHRQRAHQQVDVAGRDAPCRSTRRSPAGWRRTRPSACAGASRLLRRALIRPMRTAPCARIVSNIASAFGVAVDRVLQLGAGVTDRVGVDEDGRDAGVDHRGLERADARHFEVVDQIAGREHRPPPSPSSSSAGSMNSSCTSAAGKVTPSSSKSPVSCTAPFVIGTCATMVLPMLACQMRTVATPSLRHAAGIDQAVA